MSEQYKNFKFVPSCKGLLYNQAKETFTVGDEKDQWFEFIDFYPSFRNVSEKSFTNIIRTWSFRQKDDKNIVGFMILVELGAIPYEQLKDMKVWNLLTQELKDDIKKGKLKGKVLGTEFASPSKVDKTKEINEITVDKKQISDKVKDVADYGPLEKEDEEDFEEDGDVIVKKAKVKPKPKTENNMEDNKPIETITDTTTTLSHALNDDKSVVIPNKPKRGRPFSSAIKELTCTKCGVVKYFGPKLVATFASKVNSAVEEYAKTWCCSTCVPRRRGRKPFATTNPDFKKYPKQTNCIKCNKPVAILPKQIKDKADRNKVSVEWLLANYKCRDCIKKERLALYVQETPQNPEVK